MTPFCFSGVILVENSEKVGRWSVNNKVILSV